MQIICTLLQTDNHASTSPLSFYRPDDFPAAQPTASKHCMVEINPKRTLGDLEWLVSLKVIVLGGIYRVRHSKK